MLSQLHIAILCAIGLTIGPVATHADPGLTDGPVAAVGPASSEVMQVRLAATLTRYARAVLGTEPLSTQGLEAGTSFLINATTLDPESEDAWRLLLEAAVLTERPELLDRALPEVVRLAPTDTAARLKRLWLAIDRTKTLEEKADLIEKFVSAPNRSVIGDAVASRLAVRLALLYRRAGQIDQFHAWLEKAVNWDVANLDAMGLQTGVRQGLEQSDPPAWVGQLLSLYRANPTDSATAAELGTYLINHGAYRSGARMLELARNIELAAGRDAGSDLDVDIALAWWAAGEFQNAVAVLDARQTQLNQMFQQIAASNEGNRTSAIEVARLTAPLPPKLATLRAMMATESDDPTVQSDAIGEAVRSTDHLDTLREKDGVPPSARAANLHRLLWLQLAVDAPSGGVEETHSRVDAVEPLSGVSKEVAAILMDSSNSTDDRMNALQPLAGNSMLAQLKLADAQERLGHHRAAAEGYLAAWKRDPGSLLGVRAYRRLADLLGVDELPMSGAAAAMSAQIDGLPAVFDRFPSEPSLAVSIRARPQHKTVFAFDPVLIDVEIQNHTAEPLPIGPTGPINDLLMLQPTVQVPYQDLQPGSPVLIDVGRGLHLPPHGTVEFSIDLRSTWVGSTLDSYPIHGAVVKADAILNVRVATAPTSLSPSPVPGPLGSEAPTGEIRVDGQRVTPAWIDATLDRLKTSPSGRDATDVVLLAHVLAMQDAAQGGVSLTTERAAEIAATIAEVWPRLGPVSQSWVVAAAPDTDRIESLRSLIKSSTDPLVARVQLMRVVSRYSDPAKALAEPAVAAGLRSPDRSVRVLSEWIEATLQLQVELKYGRDVDAVES